ncbi:MAG TPA: RNA polymerase sigma factor [Polyangiaceae bacterium]|nr:RNA polymerase sigma factor [Polyangiaceae bacterium]
MSVVARTPLMLVPPPVGPASERPEGPAVDDSELLAGLKARDRSLSAAFYDRARPIVDRTLTRLLGARDRDYEDVAQRALFELVDTIDRFRGECPLNAWISIVTARSAYRAIRRRRIERRLFADVEPGDESPSARSHAGAVAARQALERVRRELEGMDQNRVWTFLLHDVYGYDLKEVGQITGVSLAAAQSRLVRGRREIHERIRKDEALARFLQQHPEGE